MRATVSWKMQASLNYSKIKQGADPDNLKRGYDGKHEKESSKSLQTRSPLGAFVSGSTARTTASLCGVNRKTAAFYFLRLREIIAYELETEI
jgi:hypothetical protein